MTEHSIIDASKGSCSIGQHFGGRKGCRSHWGMLLTGFRHMTSSSWFLTHPKNSSPVVASYIIGWSIPYQTQTQKMPNWRVHRPIQWRHFLSQDSFFPNNPTLLTSKLTSTPRKMDAETRPYIKQHVIVEVIKCIREYVHGLWANYPPVQDEDSLQVIAGNSRTHLDDFFLQMCSFYPLTHSSRVC